VRKWRDARLDLRIGDAVGQDHLRDVALHVKRGVVLPPGVGKVERVEHGPLAVTRDAVNAATHMRNHLVPGKLPLEDAGRPDVKRLGGALEIEKARIHRRHAAAER
jgi:hypothetical protein